MAKYSANLGFLWSELEFTGAIRAAASAGFDAVECHWPFGTPPHAVSAVLRETGLPMLCLNTAPGDRSAGEFGLAAVPGRENDARAAIDQAVAYASATGTLNVHVMAGRSAQQAGARATFLRNLDYAADRAGAKGLGVLIEPINWRDAPDYFLHHVEQAADVVREVGRANVRIMFDCYHTQIMQGDLSHRLETHLPLIGHIQIAAVPSRTEPDDGEVAYDRLVRWIDGRGYDGYIGAEYKPRASTDEGMAWLAGLRA